MPQTGYNLFVLGETGSGRHAIVTRLLEEESRHGAPPADWCYVPDFADAARATKRTEPSPPPRRRALRSTSRYPGIRRAISSRGRRPAA